MAFGDTFSSSASNHDNMPTMAICAFLRPGSLLAASIHPMIGVRSAMSTHGRANLAHVLRETQQMPVKATLPDQPVTLDEMMRRGHRAGQVVLLRPAPSAGGSWTAELIARPTRQHPLVTPKEGTELSQTERRNGLAPTMAHISTKSPRYEDWKAVFDDDSVPIKSPVPVMATIDGIGEQSVYLLDLSRLKVAQFDRLVAHIAKKSGLPEDDVRANIVDDGMLPILADDLSVSFDARLVL